MSHSKNTHNIADKTRRDTQTNDINKDEGEISCYAEGCTYAVTVSKKQSPSNEQDRFYSGQKSFISVHSTDQLCQVADTENPLVLDECNVEVLSLNEEFPSTSEESLSNEDEPITQRQKNKNNTFSRRNPENVTKTSYVPSNSKSSTVSGRQIESLEGPAIVYSDFDIPKSTMYVVGSNPGEPKMSYPDPPKRLSKAMKKTLRTIDKHKNEQNSKINEKTIRTLTKMRGILKDGGWRKDGGSECTGDTSIEGAEVYTAREDITLPFSLDFGPQAKQSPDKNVKFNKQVVIIHFKGDHFVGHSVEKLSKERDQQARNSELRKTFLTKYNEFWPTQK